MGPFRRYIAVCHPIVHRNLVHTHSLTRRVLFYTIPVVFLSVAVNITKFFETKVVAQNSIVKDESGNATITTYTIDITDLR